MNNLNNQIEDYIENLRTTEIGEQSFDDIFQIEDVSLLWIYCRFFLFHILPKQVNVFFKAFEENKNLGITKRIPSSIKSSLIKKAIYLSDKHKQSFFKKKKIKQANILFISFSKYIKLDSSGYNIFRVNKMINKLKKDKKSYNVLVAPEFSSFSSKHMENLNKKGLDIIYNHITKKERRLAKKKSRELYKKYKKLDKNTIPGWGFTKYAFKEKDYSVFRSIKNLTFKWSNFTTKDNIILFQTVYQKIR